MCIFHRILSLRSLAHFTSIRAEFISLSRFENSLKHVSTEDGERRTDVEEEEQNATLSLFNKLRERHTT